VYLQAPSFYYTISATFHGHSSPRGQKATSQVSSSHCKLDTTSLAKHTELDFLERMCDATIMGGMHLLQQEKRIS
jgi:hypothetical protein